MFTGMEPAKSIIGTLGGAAAVATITGAHISRVYRWTWPKSAGGTDGRIPVKHAAKIIAAARAKGVDLSAEAFLPVAA